MWIRPAARIAHLFEVPPDTRLVVLKTATREFPCSGDGEPACAGLYGKDSGRGKTSSSGSWKKDVGAGVAATPAPRNSLMSMQTINEEGSAQARPAFGGRLCSAELACMNCLRVDVNMCRVAIGEMAPTAVVGTSSLLALAHEAKNPLIRVLSPCAEGRHDHKRRVVTRGVIRAVGIGPYTCIGVVEIQGVLDTPAMWTNVRFHYAHHFPSGSDRWYFRTRRLALWMFRRRTRECPAFASPTAAAP